MKRLDNNRQAVDDTSCIQPADNLQPADLLSIVKLELAM